MGFESRFGGFAGWKICTGGYGWTPVIRDLWPVTPLCRRAAGSIARVECSLLRHAGFAKAVEHGRKVRRALLHPFDRNYGIETAEFGEDRLGLVHLARLRVSGRQPRIQVNPAQAQVDRLAIFVDRRVEMAEA